MAKTMTASQQPMTDGQIDNLVDKFRAAVRKYQSEFELDAVQQVLGVENLGMELLAPFRQRVEAVSSMIVRHVHVKVDRTRAPQAVLDATGRKQYTDHNVVASMPGHGEGIWEGDVYLWQGNPSMSDDEIEAGHALRDLKPADSYSLAQVNADDPAFADEYPNGTHWKNSNGDWCFATFDRWDDGRRVSVNRDGSDWYGVWLFAGLRK